MTTQMFFIYLIFIVRDMKNVTRSNKWYGEKPVFHDVCKLMRGRDLCYSVNIDQRTFVTLRNAFVNEKAWIDNHQKTNNPPDFYSDKHKLMVEIMSVNDNERPNNKGKTIDPVKMQSEKMIKHLENTGFLDDFSNNAIILPNPKLPELSREEFHNYDYYVSSFNRIIGSHIKQIPTYRKNHPDKKLIFLIMDESAAYIKLPFDRCLVNSQVGDPFPISNRSHIWWRDKNLLKVFKDADLDYILWYTPFKRILISDEYKELIFSWPSISLNVIDPKKDICYTKQYDPEKMICSEV